MSGVKLLAIAGQRPNRQVSNHDLPAHLDTSDEWIRTRTGIESRGIASDDETLLDLSVGAASKAIAEAGIDPDLIDLVLLATTTHLQPTPGLSPQIAHRLGINAGAIDIQGACAGFCYSLGVAADSVRAGSSRNVLVVGADRLSDRMDWNDRNTCYLFGDGAGATIVAPSTDDQNSVFPAVWGSDGSLSAAIEVPLGEKYLQMDGQTVFRWAITEVVRIAELACEKAGVSIRDIDVFVPHQANLRIIEAVSRSLDLRPDAVVADDIRTTGNTSAASIPLAISRMKEQGQMKPGDLALLIGFGAGMTWAGQVIRCP